MSPVPVPSAVMVVPAEIPVPVRTAPTDTLPLITLDTVSVVPEIVPIKELTVDAIATGVPFNVIIYSDLGAVLGGLLHIITILVGLLMFTCDRLGIFAPV